MGILDRLNTLVRANLHGLRGDEHEQSYRETLTDMEVTLREARQRVARVMDDERDLERQLDAGRREEEIWEKRAMHALRSGDEGKARQHLAERHRVARRNQGILDELAERRAYVGDLMRALEALDTKIDAMRERARAVAPSAKQLEHRDVAASGRDHSEPGPHAAPIGAPKRSPYRPHVSMDDDVRRWEAMLRTRAQAAPSGQPLGDPRAEDGAMRRAQASIESSAASFDTTFDAVESKVEALEADVEAGWQLAGQDTSSIFAQSIVHEDDPLYDPKLAELERRFQALERGSSGSGGGDKR